MRAAARLIINNIEMLLMFLLPALTGAIILARPLYTVFTVVARNRLLGCLLLCFALPY